MDAIEVTSLYHHLTQNGVTLTPIEYLCLLNYRGGVDFRPLDLTNRPSPFKRYRSVEQLELPRGLAANASDAIAALSNGGCASPNGFVDASLDLSGLARLLHLGAGVTRSVTGSSGRRTYFRAAMSAGNLHPLEVYVVCGPIEGLDAGVYHFAPLEFRLDRLRSIDERPFLANACGSEDLIPAASLVITGIPWRTAWKYGERGWRHLYWDAGALAANLVAAADGVGLRCRVLMGFVDQDVSRLVGVDGVEEFPLAVVEVGETKAISRVRNYGRLEPLTVVADSVSADPVVLPLITETQRAGVFDNALAVRNWRGRGTNPDECMARESFGRCDVSIDEAILRRSSPRLMRVEEVPRLLVDVGMAIASRDVVSDFGGPRGAILHHYLNVHSVAHTTRGAYLWTERGLDLLKEGDHRAHSSRLCVDQPIGGESAYTVFHATSLESVFEAYGARGYRAANLSAGLASERLALAAFALGFGASALTFIDDLVSAFLDATTSCLLVTAVGVPAYKNRPGGAPGSITELPDRERLMHRSKSGLVL